MITRTGAVYWAGVDAGTANKPEKETIIPSKVFVGNLSFQTTKSEVEALFSEIGPLADVFLPTDRNTGRPRGFAFVEFEDDSAAEQAIEKFHGHELDGRALRVNEAEERPQRAPFSGGYSGGFGGGGGGPSRNAPPKGKSRPKGSRRNLRGKKRSL